MRGDPGRAVVRDGRYVLLAASLNPHRTRPARKGQQMGSWPGSVAVFGAAGLVGSGIVYELVMSGLPDRVVAIDSKENVLAAHAIDIREAALVGAGTDTDAHTELVTGSPAELAELADTDVLVLAASRPESPGERRSSLGANLRLLREFVPAIGAAVGGGGVVLLVTNPVDILADALRRITRLDPRQIVGYSLNDSIRFREAIGRELDVHPSDIEATVLGEHGVGHVPLFSRVRVNGEPVRLDRAARQRVAEDLDGWMTRWARLEPGRSSGWATPRGVLLTLRRMAAGQLLASSVASGAAYGLSDTYVTLPSVLSPGGVAGVEEWDLGTDEQRRLAEAAHSVRGAADEVLAGG